MQLVLIAMRRHALIDVTPGFALKNEDSNIRFECHYASSDSDLYAIDYALRFAPNHDSK